MEGSWFGNDTIWRTIVDLNRILCYADQSGRIMQEPQRCVFNVADLVIAGEGEGPLKPSPKPMGVVVMSDRIWAADRFICRLAGFSETAVRYLGHLPDQTSADSSLEIVDVSGNRTAFDVYPFDPCLYLHPTAGWRGHIESCDRNA
jgi:hypothetical protein